MAATDWLTAVSVELRVPRLTRASRIIVLLLLIALVTSACGLVGDDDPETPLPGPDDVIVDVDEPDPTETASGDDFCELGSEGLLPAPSADPDDVVIREVQATGRTKPLDSHHDFDEPALWIHPTNTAHSMIIVTNKADGDLRFAGLYTYTVSGVPIQKLTGFHTNNVDIRPEFPLNGRSIDLITTSDRADGNQQLKFFRVDTDPGSETYRLLLDISGSNLHLDFEPYGQALYYDEVADRWYVFVTQRNEPYHVLQYEIGEGTGADDGKVVFLDREPERVIEHRPSADGNGGDALTLSEGMRVDQEHHALYVGEQDFGLLRYGARPSDGTVGSVVDRVAPEGGRILPQVEGVTIIETSHARGYIVVSGQNQGDTSRFEVYERDSDRYVTSIVIGSDDSDQDLPEARGTDGIFGYSGFVNEDYPCGVFIAHTGFRDTEPTALLMVPLDAIWSAEEAIETSSATALSRPGLKRVKIADATE